MFSQMLCDNISLQLMLNTTCNLFVVWVNCLGQVTNWTCLYRLVCVICVMMLQSTTTTWSCCGSGAETRHPLMTGMVVPSAKSKCVLWKSVSSFLVLFFYKTTLCLLQISAGSKYPNSLVVIRHGFICKSATFAVRSFTQNSICANFPFPLNDVLAASNQACYFEGPWTSTLLIL